MKSALHASELAAALHIAEAAGKTVMPFFRRGVSTQTKGGDSRDLVTEADLAADALIRERLRTAFPTNSILSEESSAAGEALDPTVPTWIVDPIDGTSNFAHGLPIFSISIALYHEGQCKVGVVYAPALALQFSAEAGNGAWLNGERLWVSEVETLQGAVYAADWPRNPAMRRQAIGHLSAFAEHVHTIRSVGSAALALAMVAAGWIDIYMQLTLQPWDVAAGALLIEEAGGRITTASGAPWQPAPSSVLASNGRLHEAALDIVESYH